MKNFKHIRIWLLVAVLIAANFNFMLPKASAGTLTKTSLTELGNGTNFAAPAQQSANQILVIDFKPATTGQTSLAINFNPGGSYPAWTGGSVQASPPTANSLGGVSCTNYYPNATAAAGTLTTAGSSSTLTVTFGTALGTSETCLYIGNTTTAALTNPSGAGNYVATYTLGAADSQNVGYDVMSSSGSNTGQYTITGIVPPSFTLTMCSSDTFSSLLTATTVAKTSGCNVTVVTNAASGWNLYASDANNGLKSVNAGTTLPSVAAGSNVTLAAGTPNFAIANTNNSYSTANYANSGGAGSTGGAVSNTQYYRIGTSASSTAGATQSLIGLAAISGTTPADNNYTDTINIVGSGQF